MGILETILIIAIAGVGAQWLAWRWQMPAIVLMLIAGIIVGPVTGWVDPDAVFGDLLSPMIALAVALILFEGGITLNFTQLRDGELAVRRLVIFGGPLVWLFASLAGHYIGGLSWPSATVFGGILVVTGPTVVIPLLRQAGLKHRPAEVLRWEAIVNDPVGALAAVLAFEISVVLYSHHSLADALGQLLAGLLIAGFLGWAGARALIWSFERGLVPEYLKVPVLIVAIIIVYGIPDLVLHESGLLAVTIMGVIIGNTHLPSLDEMRRFKEHVTILLVSGVFIILAARLQFSQLSALDWRAYAFVAVVIFCVRPVAVWIALMRSNLGFNERAMIGWIGPRGVVAVAVSGLFGVRLSELGVIDSAKLAPLAFLVVTATVFLHGFSIKPLARLWDLRSTAKKGVLIVGSNRFALELAKSLRELDRPVIVADRNWFRLRDFRQADIPVYYGEILSEMAELDIDHNLYSDLMALSDNDDHNALICANYGPEFGRFHVYQFAMHRSTPAGRKLPPQLGGRHIMGDLTYGQCLDMLAQGGRIAATRLSEEYSIDDHLNANPEALPLMSVPEKGDLRICRSGVSVDTKAGERLICLLPAKSEAVEEKISENPTDAA